MAGGNSYKYKTAVNPTIPVYGAICQGGYTNWDGASDIEAGSGQKIVVVEVDENNRCVGVGVTDVVIKA